MGRVLDPATAARLGGLHREHGVVTRFGCGVEAIERVAGGLAVRLADGAVLPAATVVVGIGAVPNDEWLAPSGLSTGGGLHCDEGCRAYGAPRVHAVGDVARWQHAGRGTPVRAEHWTNAVEQAGYVAADITRPGGQAPYRPVEFVWSDQYDARIQAIGQTGAGQPGDGQAGDAQAVTIERPGSPWSFAVLYATGSGAGAGAVTVSWPRAAVATRRAVTAGTPVDQAQGVITALSGRLLREGS
jgi:phthalate 3,4-dioxygenase ferredoxin reductase subunit